MFILIKTPSVLLTKLQFSFERNADLLKLLCVQLFLELFQLRFSVVFFFCVWAEKQLIHKTLPYSGHRFLEGSDDEMAFVPMTKDSQNWNSGRC
jgi:hypothetical protein